MIPKTNWRKGSCFRKGGIWVACELQQQEGRKQAGLAQPGGVLASGRITPPLTDTKLMPLGALCLHIHSSIHTAAPCHKASRLPRSLHFNSHHLPHWWPQQWCKYCFQRTHHLFAWWEDWMKYKNKYASWNMVNPQAPPSLWESNGWQCFQLETWMKEVETVPGPQGKLWMNHSKTGDDGEDSWSRQVTSEYPNYTQRSE